MSVEALINEQEMSQLLFEPGRLANNIRHPRRDAYHLVKDYKESCRIIVVRQLLTRKDKSQRDPREHLHIPDELWNRAVEYFWKQSTDGLEVAFS